jgi:hypothetical protein
MTENGFRANYSPAIQQQTSGGSRRHDTLFPCLRLIFHIINRFSTKKTVLEREKRQNSRPPNGLLYSAGA